MRQTHRNEGVDTDVQSQSDSRKEGALGEGRKEGNILKGAIPLF